MAKALLSPSPSPLLLALFLLLAFVSLSSSSSYVRPKPRETISVPVDDDADGVTPQQVHISVVGSDKMRVTWITDEDAPSIVEYGTSSGQYPSSAMGNTSSYSYVLYKSGRIHDVIIGPLEPDTVYFYRCSSDHRREFSFKTPPNNLPLKMVVVGDLGQTGWTKSTLDHISASPYDILLLPGDLSYADLYQPSWDSFGRLIEPLASSRPWMVTQGNHEIEKIPLLEPHPFKSFNSRYPMPFHLSNSSSNLFYSFQLATSSLHVLMLGSYVDFSPGSDQHTWLLSDLAKLDNNNNNNNSNTPWRIALIHAPWYNSNKAHQGEAEEMRRAMEELLYDARVDVVFAGHVHAYERFERVYDNAADPCGPLHITIGDGGNREGLADEFIEPKPEISAFREASFGHGRFEVVNGTHALWAWHRNDDDEAVVADQVWITSLASNPACRKKR